MSVVKKATVDIGGWLHRVGLIYYFFKYIKKLGSQVSHFQKREFKIQKWRQLVGTV